MIELAYRVVRYASRGRVTHAAYCGRPITACGLGLKPSIYDGYRAPVPAEGEVTCKTCLRDMRWWAMPRLLVRIP